jgi:hypothetical protein
MLAAILGLAVAGLTGASASASPIAHWTEFRSPSGNIGCYILDGTARCDINHRTWSPPPHPSSCSKEVDFVCAGDTALDPSGHPLAYGATDSVGAFRCASATTGMTCTEVHTGHGFFISIQSYRIF